MFGESPVPTCFFSVSPSHFSWFWDVGPCGNFLAFGSRFPGIEKAEKPIVTGSFPSLPKMIQSYLGFGDIWTPL